MALLMIATDNVPNMHRLETSVGAIAGGTVGGVLGLTLVIFIIWLLQRSRRSQGQLSASAAEPDEPRTSDRPLDGRPMTEIGDAALFEVHASERPNEAADNALYELAEPVYELPQHNSIRN